MNDRDIQRHAVTLFINAKSVPIELGFLRNRISLRPGMNFTAAGAYPPAQSTGDTFLQFERAVKAGITYIVLSPGGTHVDCDMTQSSISATVARLVAEALQKKPEDSKPAIRKCVVCSGTGKYQGFQCRRCMGNGREPVIPARVETPVTDTHAEKTPDQVLPRVKELEHKPAQVISAPEVQPPTEINLETAPSQGSAIAEAVRKRDAALAAAPKARINPVQGQSAEVIRQELRANTVHSSPEMEVAVKAVDSNAAYQVVNSQVKEMVEGVIVDASNPGATLEGMQAAASEKVAADLKASLKPAKNRGGKGVTAKKADTKPAK